LAAIATAFAAVANYEFSTLDVPIPGQPNRFAFPTDINDDGTILTNTTINNLAEALIVQPKPRSNTKFKSTLFSCTGIPFADTVAFSINGKGQVAGYCSDAPSAPSKQYGFVRDRNGNYMLLDFPGADGTGAFGISDDGKVTGQFYGPLRNDHGGALSYRFHCFIWDNKSQTYTQLDYPVENTYVSCFSINKRGQVLGEYITVDLDNNYLEHGFFIYENGEFSVPFPLSHDFEGGPSTYPSDMNNDGTIVGLVSPNDGTGNRLFLYDDGKFYDIPLPTGWILTDTGGMNNGGQFVGQYAVQVGIDPFFGWPIFQHHGFVATPAASK